MDSQRIPLLAVLAAPLLLALLLRPAPCQAVPADSNDTGNGPCYRQETYNATVEMIVTVQVNKTKYDWCLGGFMRCQVYKLENVDRLQNVTQVHTRNIETCCPGTEPTRPAVPGKNVSLHCVPITPPTSSTSTTPTTTTLATMPTTTTTELPTTRPTMPPPTRPKPTTARTTPPTTPTTSTTTTTTTTADPTTTTEAPTIRATFTQPRETCRLGLWGRGCPYECNCGAGWPCDQDTGVCPAGAPGPTHPSSPPTTPYTTPTTPRAATVAVAGPGAGPGGGTSGGTLAGMRETDDVPMHIALALLCIVMLTIAVAAINRRRIAKFMNSGDDGWDSETAVRCTVTGEDARAMGAMATPLGLMWGETYDTPPSPVAVGAVANGGEVRDPLAEQLAAQSSDAEHIYQEIRPHGPHGHQNGGPVSMRGPRASSDAFQ